MRIAVAADHAGYPLKTAVVEWLSGAGHEVVDFGTDSEEPVDYPPLCEQVGVAVAGSRADRGIVIGGSGQGEAIAANKVYGVRAALCLDEFTARLARQHNDANVLSLGGRILAPSFAVAIVEVFLSTGFEGGRHEQRLRQIGDIERRQCEGPSPE